MVSEWEGAPSGWSLDDRRRAEVLPFVHRLAG